MNSTMMNGRNNTWSTYHRSSVSAEICTPPIRAKLTLSPNTGAYDPIVEPTVKAHSAS